MRQSYHKVMKQRMEEIRPRITLHRIQQSTIILIYLTQLTPFCFPVEINSSGKI
ncbi:MAG: hypothetical protein WKG06_04555 [Segetibacter sp.]